MNIVITAFFTFFVMLSVYERGLFFDSDFYPYHLLLYILVFGYMIKVYLQGKHIFCRPAFALFIMCAVYLPPLLLTAESVKGTLDEIMRWASYSSFFLLICIFAEKEQNRFLLHRGFQLLGFFIAASAFAVLYGFIDYKDAVIVSQDPRFSVLNMRLSGFFQYANTFAAIISCFFLYHLISLAKEGRATSAVFTSIPLVLYGVALLLSESRASWIACIFGWCIGLFILSAKERVRYILLTAFWGAAVAGEYEQFTAAYAGKEMAYHGSYTLIFTSLLFAAAAVGITVLFRQGERRKCIPFFTGGCMLFTVVCLPFTIPENLEKRLLHRAESTGQTYRCKGYGRIRTRYISGIHSN